MRGLNQRFIDDLNSGLLAPVRERVLADGSLCLEIREDYVSIYYRGGNLLRLSAGPTGYAAFFDAKYAKGDGGVLSQALPAVEIRNGADVNAWIEILPRLKKEMDMFFRRHPQAEREAQQLI